MTGTEDRTDQDLVTTRLMPSPKAMFQSADLTLLCTKKIEGQFYERKAKRAPDVVAQTICAFANSNAPEGGLLAVGIADDGEIVGLANRPDVNLNDLLNYNYYTGTYSTRRRVECINCKGERDEILLIYVPYLENRVAETSNGKAYVRRGNTTVELRDVDRRYLEFEKGQISFEDETACEYHPDLLMDEIVQEFRKSVAELDHVSISTPVTQILLSRHLLTKTDARTNLTKSGLLLLAKDPRAVLPGA